jgi:hypothetical protein
MRAQMEMIEHAPWLRANNQLLQKLRGRMHIDLPCQFGGREQRTQSEKLMRLHHKGELRY